MKEFKKENDMTDKFPCFDIFILMINIVAPICFMIYFIKDIRQRNDVYSTFGDIFQYIFMRFGAIGTSMSGIYIKSEYEKYNEFELTTKWLGWFNLGLVLIANCIAFGLFVYWTVSIDH